jgi:hypothetical protein
MGATMSELSGDLNQSLRAEKSWIDVAGGLGRVLWGYAALIGGWTVAGAFIFGAYAPILNHKQVRIEHIWYFYIGAGVLKVAGLLSWGLILAGQWRCLMSSTERRGARWVIFFCLTCVVMGPVLHMLAWFGGLSTPIRWTGGPQAFQGLKLKFTLMGLYVMCASLITSGLYKLSFWYYLQTVAACMGASKARIFVWLYGVLVLGVAGATAWWLFGDLHRNRFTDLAPWIALGWVSVAAYWVMMIVVVKFAIEQTVALIYDPMKNDFATRPQYQLAGS